ncbi:hypothetical protein Hamer_G007954, partial [Homarus americanus]
MSVCGVTLVFFMILDVSKAFVTTHSSSAAVRALLETTTRPTCTLALLTDGTTSHQTLYQVFGPLEYPLGVFEVDSQDANVTQEQLS